MPYRTNAQPPKRKGYGWLGRFRCWLSGCPESLMGPHQSLGTIQHMARLPTTTDAAHVGNGRFVFVVRHALTVATFDVLERQCERCGRIDRDLRPVDHDLPPEPSP